MSCSLIPGRVWRRARSDRDLAAHPARANELQTGEIRTRNQQDESRAHDEQQQARAQVAGQLLAQPADRGPDVLVGRGKGGRRTQSDGADLGIGFGDRPAGTQAADGAEKKSEAAIREIGREVVRHPAVQRPRPGSKPGGMTPITS